MSEYNPVIHHRRSIRLKGYDYSQAGIYFVTLCVQNRQCVFGKIANGKMALNDAGKMIEKWCAELSHKFPDIIMDAHIVMPNHCHAIIINTGGNGDDTVGADLRVCPNNISGENQGKLGEYEGRHAGLPQRIGSPPPLSTVIQWFKTMTTNEYIRGVKTLGWQPFNGKLWQRDYYEHIIRNEQAYQRIAEYIINNPAKWDNDSLK